MAKVVVKASLPVMLGLVLTKTTLRGSGTVMVMGPPLAMDLAMMSVLVTVFGALLATTPAIVAMAAHLVREQFMMVPVVVPTAVMSLHAGQYEVSLEKDKRLLTSFCTF